MLLVWVVPGACGRLLTSLKSEKDVLAYPPARASSTPTLDNYHDVLFGSDLDRAEPRLQPDPRRRDHGR